MPDDADPPRDHRPGRRDHRGDDARAVLPRRRHRREPQRARPRRPLARLGGIAPEMLEEAVGLMRELWSGGVTSHRGRLLHRRERAIYTLPEEPIEIMVAAGGAESAAVAGRIGDGIIATSPESELLRAYARMPAAMSSGSARSPFAGRRPVTRRYGQLSTAGRTPDFAARSRRNCRCRATSRQPQRWSPSLTSPRPLRAGPIPRLTSRRSPHISRPVTTTSMSTRSGTISVGSSASTNER